MYLDFARMNTFPLPPYTVCNSVHIKHLKMPLKSLGELRNAQLRIKEFSE